MAEIPPREFVLLGKLMALTTSNHDGEALTSLRKANAILTRHKLTWMDVLNARPLSVEETAEAMREAAELADREEVDEAFDELLGPGGIAHGSFRICVEDLRGKWNRYGQLSPKQRRVVLEALARHRFYRQGRATAHG